MSVVNFLVPFEELSGINAPETDFDGGVGQQLWGLAAAALPTSSGCDAVDCLPVSPTGPITGISGVDWFIWPSQILNGQQEFPLFDNLVQSIVRSSARWVHLRSGGARQHKSRRAGLHDF
jgi:hypothetical protein